MPDFADPVTERLNQALIKVGPHGYVHGWRYVGGPGLRAPFASDTKPGSFEHVNAIENLGREAGASTGDPGHASPVMASALHNVARSVAMRDMTAARAHLADARAANRSEAGGKWSSQLSDLDHQLKDVPAASTGWQSRRELNPLSPQAQHLGTYVAGHDTPFDPTADAMQESMSEPTAQHPDSLAAFAHAYPAITARMRSTGEPGEIASREVMAGKAYYLHVRD